MFCLGIQTAGRPVGLALLDGTSIIAQEHVADRHRYTETLIASITRFLKAADLSVSELDCLGVCIGPGSYTGLRLGVTTAKTIAMVRDQPLYGVSTLAALAFPFRFSERLILAIQPSVKGHVSAGLFGQRDGTLNRVSDDFALTEDALLRFLAALEEAVLVVGSIPVAVAAAIRQDGRHVMQTALLRAEHVANLALACLNRNEDGHYRNVNPHYLYPAVAVSSARR